MNGYSRTVPMPSVALPVRESGAPTLDRRATSWPAPHLVDPVPGRWAAPTGSAAIGTELATWPAPDPIMRVDLPAPVAFGVVALSGFALDASAVVDPLHRVAVPDVGAAARTAPLAPVPALGSIDPTCPGLPAPTLADAAVYPAKPVATVVKDRSGVARWLTLSLAGVVGAAAALAAVAIAIF
jgi:hypothetical protein